MTILAEPFKPLREQEKIAMLGSVLMAMAVASASPPPVDPCATADACRFVKSVRVQSPNGNEVELPIDDTLPWVVQDNLLIVPGDWIVIRLVEADSGLKPVLVRAGNSADAPEPGEGEIRFHLLPYNAGNLMLKAKSRYPSTLDYAAIMVTPKGPERTSVCSLRPGVTVYESWRQPIRQFALWSFRPATEPSCKVLEFPKK